jgi:hypothetical protein
MNEYLSAGQRLHHFMYTRQWNGQGLIGPDQGVRFNRRLWRYFKSALPLLPWQDDYYYLQAQGYWVLANEQLYDLLGESRFAELAGRCARGILETQCQEGYWEYPNSGWGGRIATVEVIWATLGLLASYERTREMDLLEGAKRAYYYLIDRIGIRQVATGEAINYFANRKSGSLIPNNTSLALPLFGKLAKITGDERYLAHCPEMIAFLAAAQTAAGEFPYGLDPDGVGRPHYQCYQYNAFELQDLAMYYEATCDSSVLPLITKLAHYLEASIKEDGSTRFDCADHQVKIIYNTAAIAAALGISRRMGLHDSRRAEERAYAYVLAQQHENGGFPFSTSEYIVLRDRRYYPRPMSMILYHLLLKAKEISSATT